MSSGTNKERIEQNTIEIQNLRTEASQLPLYLNTSDATATENDILVGKTAYVNGKKIVGSCISPYTKLEYIESDGNQYIDINTPASSSIGVELVVQCTNTNKAAFFGAWQIYSVSGTETYDGIMFGQSTDPEYNSYVMATSSLWKPSGVSLDVSKYHTFIYDAKTNKGTVDGSICNVPANNGNSLNMYMFRVNGFDERTSGVRISNCKIYDNGVLIHNYIPVKRNIDNEICMYDLVAQEYVLNAGTGNFIAGPNVDTVEGIEYTYEQLDYIESNGTQYINTNYLPSTYSQFELYYTNNTTSGVLFGGYNTSWMDGFGVYSNVATLNDKFYFHYKGNNNTNITSYDVTEAKIRTNMGYITINNSTFFAGNVNAFRTSYPLYIFGGNMGGNLEQPVTMQLHNFVIKESETILHNYIPVRRIYDGVLGLYDLITKEFLMNSGTGEFIAGPVKEHQSNILNQSYQRVEYIESNGTQYIDTGVTPVANSSWATVDFMITRKVAGQEQWALGQYYINRGWRCGGTTNSAGYFTYNTSLNFTISNTSATNIRVTGFSTYCNLTTPYNMMLFAQCEQGNAAWLNGSYIRVYGCTMYTNSQKVREFVPCYRLSDNSAGMLDVCNDIFYTNLGTGKFILGPVIV